MVGIVLKSIDDSDPLPHIHFTFSSPADAEARLGAHWIGSGQIG